MGTQNERCLFCGSSNLTFNSSMDIVCEACGKKQPKENAKVELSNDHLFYRKNGLPCPNCGSKTEYLWVVGNSLFLVCSGCEQNKGKDPFQKTE